MGHLHRQALVQRAKARDALAAQGVALERAKAAVESLSLAAVGDLRAAPQGVELGASALKPSRKPKRKASRRSKGKRRAKA